MSFTVYKSSAGSGKTYTLVKEYLKIALGSSREDDYKHILAITFTNKAANEMKDRVLSALIGISEQDSKAQDLVQLIAKETNLTEQAVEKKAAEVLKHILHHYADFSISTIDKFVHKIIRIFAFDLKLPMNFEVELDSKELLGKAIDELISRVGKDEQLTKTLLKYTEEKADAEKSWHIENDIEEFAGSLLKDEHQEYIAKLKTVSLEQFFELRKKVASKLKSIEAEIKIVGGKALNLIKENNIDVAAFAGGKNGLPKYFEYLYKVKLDKLVPSNTVKKNILEDKWFAGKATSEDKNSIESIKTELLDYFSWGVDFVEQHLSEYIELSLLNDNIYGLAVLNEIEKVVDEIKSENNILHISEFNKRIAEIVLSEPAPFIYERIGERFSHYLIDEFQDTSELQWQNLLPLIDNSLATGKFNMLVGDGKQAIYRWRGGEVEQFSMLPKLPAKFTDNPVVKEREDTLVRNFEDKRLGTNYRSKQNIVEFNNAFFKRFSEQLEDNFKNIYDDVAQEFLPHKTGGHVSVHVLDSKDKELYESNTLLLIKEKIENAINNGYRLSDVAILTRRNKEAIAISDYLLQHNIDVISSESLLVNSSYKVKALVAALEYLQDNAKVESRLQIINHVCQLKGIESDHKLLDEVIHSQEKFINFLQKNGFKLNSELIGYPLLELIHILAERLSINPKMDNFVAQFFEFAFKQINKKSVDVYSFLEEWKLRKEKLSINLSEGSNAVSIMTIHKSKGLQFPIVLFPFASWQLNTRGKKHWVDFNKEEFPELKTALLNHNKQLEKTKFGGKFTEENNKVLLDNINMLYVAFTRAEDVLHIVMSDNTKEIGSQYLPVLKSFESWNEEEQKLDIGEHPVNKEIREEIEEKLYLSETIPVKQKHEKLAISYQFQDYWNELEGIKGRKFGVLIHRLLSKFESLADISNIEHVVALETELNKDEQQGLVEYLRALFDSNSVKELFDLKHGEKVFIERELMMSNGDVARPDRVVVGKDIVKIIDFKTGEKQKKYEKQLNQYANALADMGHKKIESYILYTDSKEVELV